MESWTDQAIILNARPHGESGAIASLLSENHGLYSGYVHGGVSSSKKAMLTPGTLLNAEWRAKTQDSLGTYRLEQEKHLPPQIIDNPLKLGALSSACNLCHTALPEREGHPGLFHGLKTLIELLAGDMWEASYIMWEISLLKELGFALELSKCAGGGDNSDLAYISPKTGHAVSREVGKPYEDKLLELPDFLKPCGNSTTPQEILKGLHLTSYFLEHRVFIHHYEGIPEPRLRFENRYARYVESISRDKQE